MHSARQISRTLPEPSSPLNSPTAGPSNLVATFLALALVPKLLTTAAKGLKSFRQFRSNRSSIASTTLPSSFRCIFRFSQAPPCEANAVAPDPVNPEFVSTEAADEAETLSRVSPPFHEYTDISSMTSPPTFRCVARLPQRRPFYHQIEFRIQHLAAHYPLPGVNRITLKVLHPASRLICLSRAPANSPSSLRKPIPLRVLPHFLFPNPTISFPSILLVTSISSA